MPTDSELDRTITSAVRADPRVHGLDVGVTVREGLATLTGSVRSYAAKGAAGDIALRIRGIRAVANELQVRPESAMQRTDGQIAAAVLDALTNHAEIPDRRLRVRVGDGHVLLEGEVDWHYQRLAAEAAVKRLVGVRDVTNRIRVSEWQVPPQDARERIEEAIVRALGTDEARSVMVDVAGRTVTLSGFVRTYDEIQGIDAAAWNVPGITRVDNRLAITVTVGSDGMPIASGDQP
jgi:osmotically-inducible protein OsmY